MIRTIPTPPCSRAIYRLEPLIDLLAKSAPGSTKAVRRRKGVAAMAGLVGALLLARAIGKRELSDEILDATRRELLDR
jgi:TetR/AcrR family transcriptional regulator, transcriptional repressor for nem operon